MNGTGQFCGHLNGHAFTRFTVRLQLVIHARCIDVIAFGQGVAGIQLPNRTTCPFTWANNPLVTA